MKLLFLGTAADDWYKKPEEELTDTDRRRCSLLIDGHILMDAAQSSYDFARRLGVDTAKITDVVISHSHSDHLSAEALLKFRRDAGAPIHIWCHTGAVGRLGLSEEEKQLFCIHPLTVGERCTVAGYSVLPLAANHGMPAPEQALHYVWSRDDTHLFYGCDGAWIMNESWRYMKDVPFDCMIWDATFGDVWDPFFRGKLGDCGHNTLSMLKLLIPMVKEHGCTKESCIHIGNHFSRQTHEDHAGTEKILAAMGMRMACDGMTLEF